MTFATYLRNVLYESETRRLDVDGVELIGAHRRILERKPLLKSAFTTFYGDMIDSCDRWFPTDGLEIELGSGVGFFKKLRPSVVTSDVRSVPDLDRVIDAQQMDLPNEVVRCIYGINVFHHIPDPDRFFAELCRVLKPNGGCILIEPHNGLGSRLLHRYLHKDEHFDPDASSWMTTEVRGPMSGANQALAYIVFERDRASFTEKYGRHLEIVHSVYCLNALRYLLSGGLNFRQMSPSFAEPFLRAIERSGRPWARHWSFHQLVVLRKRC